MKHKTCSEVPSQLKDKYLQNFQDCCMALLCASFVFRLYMEDGYKTNCGFSILSTFRAVIRCCLKGFFCGVEKIKSHLIYLSSSNHLANSTCKFVSVYIVSIALYYSIHCF